jgi:hypothetical protein
VDGLSIARVELDSSHNMPMTALETAQVGKAYFEGIGSRFQSWMWASVSP